MDLIDLMHINNDIMSYSLAFASLAYSVGGLLSGFLFNYVNRQILISIYFAVFGVANIATPYMSNYIVYSVITVFKMMCAGGTDCGGNVWILEMWPGKDAWLQALHFSFAVGCALGPLLVEPFLSEDPIRGENALAAEGLDRIKDKTSGSTTISEGQYESRIHIPYAVSGSACLLASAYILYLYFLDKKLKAAAAKLQAKQQAAAGEHILLTALQHPAAIEAGADHHSPNHQAHSCCSQSPSTVVAMGANSSAAGDQATEDVAAETTKFLTPAAQTEEQQSAASGLLQAAQVSGGVVLQVGQLKQDKAADTSGVQDKQIEVKAVKITSKAREQAGRPPYYVIFAIAIAAMCLSFYCGIEITSMNYLATFVVHIDLQLPKSTAALMSSALTISFAVGRGLGIWVANYIKPHKLFYSCCAIMALGNVAMFIFANTAETLLWCSICLFGIGCGPMFPAIVSFFDDRISKVTNTVSGIFILGSMFNVALNSLIIGHHIIDNALILIVCNLVGSVVLLLLFGTLHMLTKVKKNQRVKKFRLKQQAGSAPDSTSTSPLNQQAATAAATTTTTSNKEQQIPEVAVARNNNNNSNNNDNDKNQRQSPKQHEENEQTPTKTTQPTPTDRVAITIENDA